MNFVLSKWIGCTVNASDGNVGTVRQIYFDDLTWKIRYLVVLAGGWLAGREVLISPTVLGKPDWKKRLLPVRLTQLQVRHSPEADYDLPVDRQHEIALARHYGWQSYWDGAYYIPPGLRLDAIPEEALAKPGAAPSAEMHKADPHLRSSKEIIGYKIHALDGDLGHAVDFVVDDIEWQVRYLVVDTRKWLPDRHVLISPQWISRIRWADGRIFVNLAQHAIRNSPVYDPSKIVSAAYEKKLSVHLQQTEPPVWVAFKFHASPGTTVCLTGTFNGWNPAAMRLGDEGNGIHATMLLLPVGRYEYKFVVNGAWQNGPHSGAQVPNAFGSTNNVLVVEKNLARKEHLHTFPRQSASPAQMLVTAPLTD